MTGSVRHLFLSNFFNKNEVSLDFTLLVMKFLKILWVSVDQFLGLHLGVSMYTSANTRFVKVQCLQSFRMFQSIIFSTGGRLIKNKLQE